MTARAELRRVVLALALVVPWAIAEAQEASPTAPSPDVVATPGEPVDFDIEETSGVTRNLRDLRGRVVVLWYEDRDHTDTNHALKLELHQYIVDNHLEGQVTNYGIANVHGIDGVVRDMARTAIRAMAAQYGIQILLDWECVIQAAPFYCAVH